MFICFKILFCLCKVIQVLGFYKVQFEGKKIMKNVGTYLWQFC